MTKQRIPIEERAKVVEYAAALAGTGMKNSQLIQAVEIYMKDNGIYIPQRMCPSTLHKWATMIPRFSEEAEVLKKIVGATRGRHVQTKQSLGDLEKMVELLEKLNSNMEALRVGLGV